MRVGRLHGCVDAGRETEACDAGVGGVGGANSRYGGYEEGFGEVGSCCEAVEGAGVHGVGEEFGDVFAGVAGAEGGVGPWGGEGGCRGKEGGEGEGEREDVGWDCELCGQLCAFV